MHTSEKELAPDFLSSTRQEIPDGLEVVYNVRHTILSRRHYDYSATPPMPPPPFSSLPPKGKIAPGGPLTRAATMPLDLKSKVGSTTGTGDVSWGYSDLKYGDETRTIKSEEKIWRLQRTIYILIALLILVVIGGAVGGGIGSHLAVQNALNARPTVTVVAAGASTSSMASSTSADIPSSTSPVTPASTSSSSSTPSSTPTPLPLDCPGLDTQGDLIIKLEPKSWRFKAQCGVAWGGEPLAAIVANSFNDCLVACAQRNYGKTQDECVAVEFVASIPAQGAPGNCALKGQKTGEVGGRYNMAGASLVKA